MKTVKKLSATSWFPENVIIIVLFYFIFVWGGGGVRLSKSLANSLSIYFRVTAEKCTSSNYCALQAYQFGVSWRMIAINSIFFFFQLQDFIAGVVKGGPLSWSVQQAIERVKINIQWRKTNEKDVEKWLRDYFNRPIKPTFGPPAKWGYVVIQDQ